MAWNGTAAGWLGFENNRKLCRAIEQETGVPATTTVLALYQGSVIKTHRDGFAWFSARRARRSDAGHRKTGATTSESHAKPPFGRVRVPPEGVRKP